MSLDQHVIDVRDQLLALGAAAGGPVEEAAGRLAIALEPALRLALQRALTDAADSLRDQLGEVATVEVRLEAGEPVLVGVPAVVEPRAETLGLAPTVALPAGPAAAPASGALDSPPTDEDAGVGVTRFTLRLPQQLKARIDAAAAGESVSVNSWMVRTAERAIAESGHRSARRSGNSLSGWIG
ncbi:toxin-antitoxin system HicB family antitoxin [Salana multivorans]